MDVTPRRPSTARRKYLAGLARTAGDVYHSDEPWTPKKESQSVLRSLRMVSIELDLCKGCSIASVSPPRMERAGSLAAGSPIRSPGIHGEAALSAAAESLQSALVSPPRMERAGCRFITGEGDTVLYRPLPPDTIHDISLIHLCNVPITL